MPLARAQDTPNPEAPPKYKFVTEIHSTPRVKKNRVILQAVVKVTDENDVPVAGVAVTFTIPQIVGGTASFVKGGVTSVVATSAAGFASSGSFVASTTSR